MTIHLVIPGRDGHVEAVIHHSDSRLAPPLRQPNAQAAVHRQRKVNVHGGAARQRRRLPAAGWHASVFGAVVTAGATARCSGMHRYLEDVSFSQLPQACVNHQRDACRNGLPLHSCQDTNTAPNAPTGVQSPVEVVAGQGAEGRHLQVRVRVDAARHDQLAGCVDDPSALRHLQ